MDMYGASGSIARVEKPFLVLDVKENMHDMIVNETTSGMLRRV